MRKDAKKEEFISRCTAVVYSYLNSDLRSLDLRSAHVVEDAQRIMDLAKEKMAPNRDSDDYPKHCNMFAELTKDVIANARRGVIPQIDTVATGHGPLDMFRSLEEDVQKLQMRLKTVAAGLTNNSEDIANVEREFNANYVHGLTDEQKDVNRGWFNTMCNEMRLAVQACRTMMACPDRTTVVGWIEEFNRIASMEFSDMEQFHEQSRKYRMLVQEFSNKFGQSACIKSAECSLLEVLLDAQHAASEALEVAFAALGPQREQAASSSPITPSSPCGAIASVVDSAHPNPPPPSRSSSEAGAAHPSDDAPPSYASHLAPSTPLPILTPSPAPLPIPAATRPGCRRVGAMPQRVACCLEHVGNFGASTIAAHPIEMAPLYPEGQDVSGGPTPPTNNGGE